MKLASPRRAALIGWQTLLADLSLILFMVTAAAMAANSRHHSSVIAFAKIVPKRPSAPTLGEPLALWRAGGAQTLGHWLAGEEPDARQQLTITAHYRKGAAVRALTTAQALVGEAGAMGKDARVIVAPAADADGEETLASLAYDQAPGVAQDLHRDRDSFAGNSP